MRSKISETRTLSNAKRKLPFAAMVKHRRSKSESTIRPPSRAMIISNDEAKGTVEEKLRKQQRTKPMTETEMTAFCRAMIKNLDLNDDCLSDIRRWTESWQSTYFRSPSGK